MPIPSRPNFRVTPIEGIHEYDSRNCIEDIELSKFEKITSAIASDIPDVIRAMVLACWRVFAMNVMSAPTNEIRIINEIKPAIISLRV
jgi:hypothetical protein